MKLWSKTTSPADAAPAPRFKGTRAVLDGASAARAVETGISDDLLTSPADSAAVTAGMSMAGLRTTGYASGQGAVAMHESLRADSGQRLTYVLNVTADAATRQGRSGHAGHEGYHAVDDAGVFQLFAKDVQEVADLNLVAHRIAELSLNPGLVAQDAVFTSRVIEPLAVPEPALIREYLGDPADQIECPTEAQRLVFGETRRRIPEMFDLDYPAIAGSAQNEDSYAQGVAAQRPFYFDHIAGLAEAAFLEFARLTGRKYGRVSDYRLDDAEWVIVCQGSVVGSAEAVADHLRAERGIKVGVLNLTMFRPFPADLITSKLALKKGVVVMERTDQPLSVDPPLLREIRAAMSRGLENGRHAGSHDGLQALRPGDVPEFYSACFGLGGRDLQPGDIVAAVENMLKGGASRRQFYLGLDFAREGTRLPKLQIWQESVIDRYPHLARLALPRTGALNLLPKEAIALRIHSVGGWDVAAMAHSLATIAFEGLGLHVKAAPPSVSEKKGQPATCSLVMAHEPIRWNGLPARVDAVLAPDPNVFRHGDPLAGLVDGGVLVVQTPLSPEEFWKTLKPTSRRTIIERGIKVHCLDAFAIARVEAATRAERYRMMSAVFIGAFFSTVPLLQREGKTVDAFLASLGVLLQRRPGVTGVADTVRVIGRGCAEVTMVAPVPLAAVDERGDVPHIPLLIDSPDARPGPGHAGRFWEQVCSVRQLGQDGLADPFAAIGLIPAATAAARDMSAARLDVPEFNGAKCTGCAECWTQCPDSAIPGLVNSVEEVLEAAIGVSKDGAPMDRIRPLVRPWAKETHRLLQKEPRPAAGLAFALAYDNVASKMGWEAERRSAVDAEFHVVQARLAEFPLARTKAFFDEPEAKAKGTGGLLSVTINPEACKGCNICVEVCAEGALVTTSASETGLVRLRRNWALWNRLPDTDDRFINPVAAIEGTGIVSSLLLKKNTYRSMVGGDGACSGCGEKTAAHLILSAIHAQMAPRVTKHITDLDALIDALDVRARELLASGADLRAAASAKGAVAVPVDESRRLQLEIYSRCADALRDLRWRYVQGPSGKGRAALGMANSAGCSSVWAGTYPYTPYPFPWVSHLSADSPSVAIGLFEAHMRKMARGFAAVRRAAMVLDGTYDAVRDEPALGSLSWTDFTDDEFALCPPILAMGGDGAMLDAGFQGLSRLLSSGRPLRVIVLDTQGHSDLGGEPSTATFGRQAARKEIALLAMFHRGVFVHQSSQASPAHLMTGVLKGLRQRRPALFNIYAPCPMEHGIADAAAPRAARLALESRAFPFLTYDPERGGSIAECLSLDGNPDLGADWPVYTLRHLDGIGVVQKLVVPLTIADWAATEGRFESHFSELPPEQWDEAVPFDVYVRGPKEEHAGKVPFIHAVGPDRRLRRLKVSTEIVALAEERLAYWSMLRQLGGVLVSPVARQSVAAALETEFDAKVAALRMDHEAQIAQLKRDYPQQIARRLAEGLMRHGGGGALAELLATLPQNAPVAGTPVPARSTPGIAAESAPIPTLAPEPAVPEPVKPGPTQEVTVKDDEPLTLEAYIDSARCTTCNECINLNKKVFAYNAAKQAEIKDARAGTFQQLVLAAERCPVSIIHPGSPANPDEKDLAKWVKRAEKFN